MIGIYQIRNILNNKRYIGQSADIHVRKLTHFRDLKENRHVNNHLQNSYNKYQKENFKLEIIEECLVECLNDREQFWLDFYPKTELYNSHLYVVDMKGAKNHFYGKRHTKDSKKAMSKWKKENYQGKNNPNFGKKQSLQTRTKMSENRTKKLDKKDVLNIVVLLKEGVSHQEIANKYNITRTVITRISNGTRYAIITGGPVVPVVYENGKRVLTDLHKQKIGVGRTGKLHSETTKLLMKEKALLRKRGE